MIFNGLVVKDISSNFNRRKNNNDALSQLSNSTQIPL